jgi:hypothetical protein
MSGGIRRSDWRSNFLIGAFFSRADRVQSVGAASPHVRKNETIRGDDGNATT